VNSGTDSHQDAEMQGIFYHIEKSSLKKKYKKILAIFSAEFFFNKIGKYPVSKFISPTYSWLKRLDPKYALKRLGLPIRGSNFTDPVELCPR
jgi:hypothetical protein